MNPWIVASFVCFAINVACFVATVVAIKMCNYYVAIGTGVGAYISSVVLGAFACNIVKRKKTNVERAIVRKWLAEIELVLKEGEEKSDE